MSSAAYSNEQAVSEEEIWQPSFRPWDPGHLRATVGPVGIGDE